jgi:hypothetical protein
MVVFFTKENSKFSQGQLVPFMEIPVNQEGEKVELNDFQWWAPTEKWDQWLKANPREWKAESENPIFKKSTREIFESLVEGGKIDPSVVSFTEFSSLMEEEVPSGTEVSDEEAEKRLTKLVFAYNKLLNEDKIITDISFEDLETNIDYALFLDLQGEDGKDIEQTRNAYRFKRLPSSDSSKLVLGESTETILSGPIPDGASMADTFIKTGKVVARVLTTGAFTIAGVALGVKAFFFLAGRYRWYRILGQVIPGLKTASYLGKNAWYVVKTVGGIVPFVKGTAMAISAMRGGKNFARAIKIGSLSANSARLAAGVAKGSNPIGWIITGVMAVQQTYNWFSGNQAPRFGEIEDEGIDARDSFSPGSIPDGSEITICWTQEAGQSGLLASIGNVFVTNDTRTTMNLLKMGNFNGKALFFLISIQSEMYDKMLKENPTIFVSFDENATFDHGFTDNDEIFLELIIPAGGKDAGSAGFFHGYCKWSDLQQTYDSADSQFLSVPGNAPKEYSFYFKSGKGSREVNVTGSLVENLEDVQTVKATFDVPEDTTAPKNESNKFEVLKYSEFQSASLNEDYSVFEEESSEDVNQAQKDIAGINLTETQKVASYEVISISFADPLLEDQDLPELRVFIVPIDYLEAKDNSPIQIDAVQNIIIKDPIKGSIKIESEEAPEPIIVGPTGSIEPNEPNIQGGVPVEVTPDEIKIRYRDNPDALNAMGISDITKIKDRDKEDKIKILDMITPEEKKELEIEDWDYIKKVKIYRDGETGEPIMVKFKSGGTTSDRKRKIKFDDPRFDTALKVSNRIEAGFQKEGQDEEDAD